MQFARFVANASQGEFGLSYRQGRKVSTLLRERLPATLELSLAAAVLALVIGMPMGVYTALRRRGFLSNVFLAVSLLGVSLPTFLIGILLIMVFAVNLGWLPSYGRGETIALGWWTTGLLTPDGLKHLMLPAVTLCLFQMTLIMRLVRSEMLEVLRTDYIKFARARGLPDRVVHFGHALKNTLVPVITIAGLQLGAIIAFAIITETVFQWPGMGLLFIQAVQSRRRPDHGGIPVPDRARVRADQPRRRPAVFRRRSAPARRAQRRGALSARPMRPALPRHRHRSQLHAPSASPTSPRLPPR